MGVPSFYRWLVGKYPKIVVNAIEVDGDSSEPNPNEMEFDNLYLDMNGIIHPCFHPEDQIFPPTTYDEVFNAIFAYTDRIFHIVRPRNLLYVAIDGVAPRAKMNQQRSRRFRAAKEAEVAEEEEKLRHEFERAGKKVLPKEEYEISDSTVITPGTVFMQKLSKALEYYIRLRLSGDPGWNQIKVILSDSNVPGEGEHKIMSFIRLQRDLAGYDPNTRHCLYGLDADLIMLALASHELHFSILREDVLKEHNMFEAILSTRGWEGVPTGKKVKRKTPYQFLHIWTLREYLAVDMRISDPPVEFDIERIVDDFIFICFFTGNDFLPHMPSIEIHEGAIDLLIAVYKNLFNKMGGYLVDTKRVKERKTAYIKLKRVEQFISKIGSYEDKIFEKRYQLRQKRIQRWLRESLKEGNDEDDLNNMCESVSSAFANRCSTSENTSEKDDVYRNTVDLKQKLKDLLRDKGDLFKNGVFENDKVKLGIPGWKARYYEEKFSAENPNQVEVMQKAIVKSYIEGLCWVLQYYFAGVSSWCWYYPYHYGPFASDLKGISGFEIKFKLGFPLKPFDQLMAILPPRSSHALPKSYQQLMSSEDSVIKKFYPSNFLEDMDGKRFAWQGIVKLPFIEEELLLSATKLHEKELGIDEVQRNMIKNDKILVMKSHSLSSQICSIYTASGHVLGKIENKHCIDPARANLNGYLALCDDHTGTTEDHTISASFINPGYHVHKPVLLENVIEPEKTITEADIVERKLWHEYEGPNPQPSIRQQMYIPSTSTEMCGSAGSGWRGRGKEPEMLPYTGWHESGGGGGRMTSVRGGGGGRMTSVRGGGRGLMTSEMYDSAGSGWRGRGKEPEMLPYTGWHASGGGGGHMTSVRGGGRGLMTSETRHFGWQPDSYPLNGNQASHGFYSNFSDAVYCTRNASFQPTMNMLSDGRNNNWQWRSAEMATTNMNAVDHTRSGFQTPMNRSLDGRSNDLQWRSSEIATSDASGCGNHPAIDGGGPVINMMPSNQYTRGRVNHAAMNGRGPRGRGNHAPMDGRGPVINMMPSNQYTRGHGNHAAMDGRGPVINMMPNNQYTRGRGNHAAMDGRGRVINMMPNNHRGRGNHAAVDGRGRGIDRMPSNSSYKSDPNRFSSISEYRNDGS